MEIPSPLSRLFGLALSSLVLNSSVMVQMQPLTLHVSPMKLLDQINAKVNAFHVDDPIKQLEDAEYALVRLPALVKEELVPFPRQEITKAWLNLLLTADKSIDPSFPDDPKYYCTMGVIPGRDSDGTVYPPGVQPDVIQDAGVRSAYEKECADNSKRIETANYQIYLQRTRNLIALNLRTYRANYYNHSFADQAEYNRLVEAFPINEASKADIKKSLFE